MTMQKFLCGTGLVLVFLASFSRAEASLSPTPSLAASIRALQTFPSLPAHEKESKFAAVEKGFEERSNLFLKGKHFQKWALNRKQKDIYDEFKRIEEWRNHSWYAENTGDLLISRTDFMVAQDLLEKGYYKKPNNIAFQYNQTDGSYNSSTIVLNGYHFLVLETPSVKNIHQFYKLLQNFQVTQLIRLAGTTSTDGSHDSESYPYWQASIKQDVKTKGQYIHIPLAGVRKTYPIRYYFETFVKDNKGIDAKNLLKLIQSVRKDMDPNYPLIACHSTNGVGETGSFVAGFLLLQAIDQSLASGTALDDLNISIEEIVMKLSMQRLFMVDTAEQYLSLYRLVDLYIQSLKK